MKFLCPMLLIMFGAAIFVLAVLVGNGYFFENVSKDGALLLGLGGLAVVYLGVIAYPNHEEY